MKLPIGYDNFGQLIERKLYFVDKSLLIKEIIDDTGTQVVVLTRPRRFGKTLNLSMLHHFLAKEVYGRQTQGMFTGLKISQVDGDYLQYQGKCPVIFITFKDVKDHHYPVAYRGLVDLMAGLYREHRYLLSSDHLVEEDKEIFEAIIFQKAKEEWIQAGLKNLCRFLFQHHGVRPWLLIDEYDTPLQSAYLYGYYEDMISLLRAMLGAALKTNPYLERAVITGILRVSKESLFSGLNNLKVHSLLSTKYSTCFGFTEEEVSDLLRKTGLEEQGAGIREWYNGYRMGTTTIYNPWSLINCLDEGGQLKPYWVNTSDNQLIRTLLTDGSESFREQFETLLRGESIEKLIDENVVFGDLKQSEMAAWSLILMSGYLKVVDQTSSDRGLICRLAIPNREVRGLYLQIIERWLTDGRDPEWFNKFLHHLLSGNMEAFTQDFQQIVEDTFSVHDTARDPEAFYHGFMVGVTANLYYHPNYEIKSNRESGYGRYDYMIYSHDASKPTILLEIKRVRRPDTQDPALIDKLLTEAATQAMAQIHQQKYLTEARQRGRTNLLAIALAFCGKRFQLQTSSM